MKTKSIAILLGLAMTASLTGCGGTDSPKNTTAAPSSQAESSAASESTAPKEVTVKHELGETTLATEPERIVVFDYGTLDALDYAGIDVVGLGKGGNLADHLSKFSGEEYKVAGSLHEPDFEVVNELKPDLILISARAAKSYEELSKIAPTVYMTMPTNNYFDSFQANLNILSQIFPSKADVFSKAIAEIEVKVKEVHEKVTAEKWNALVIMANDSELSVFGQGSRFSIVYDDFGFQVADQQVDDSTHGQTATFEYLAEKNPDYLFVIDRGAATGAAEATGAKKLLDNELMNGTKAAENDRIVYLDSTNWYVVSGGITATKAMVDEVAASLK
ncbi:siderophore ABC transporter substrate-binding protein [Lacrimispora brassicae]